MFRYHYDVSRDCWLIQFLKWGLFWMTAQTLTNNSFYVDLRFETIEQAKAHAVKRGITDVYYQQQFPRERDNRLALGTGAL